MNTNPVDVLAVLAEAAECVGGPTDLGLSEARVAVAELIEAAKGVAEMEHEPRFLYGEIESLRAALAKVGAA